MKITKAEVNRVAGLARLDVDEAASEKFADQIGQILAYVDTLDRLDTRDIPPMSHAISLTNAFREDITRESLDAESALANAPEREEGMFVVPKIIG